MPINILVRGRDMAIIRKETFKVELIDTTKKRFKFEEVAIGQRDYNVPLKYFEYSYGSELEIKYPEYTINDFIDFSGEVVDVVLSDDIVVDITKRHRKRIEEGD